MAFASISEQLFKHLKISILNRFLYQFRFRHHLKSREKMIRYQTKKKSIVFFSKETVPAKKKAQFFFFPKKLSPRKKKQIAKIKKNKKKNLEQK